MNKLFIVAGLVATLAITFACVGGTPLPPTPAPVSVTGVTAGISNPMNGTILGLVASPVLTFASSTATPITAVGLIVNGHSVGVFNPATRVYGVDHTFTWTPAAVGEYYLQVQTNLLTGQHAVSAAVRVCVLNPAPAAVGVSGYLGPCAVPTRIPSAPTTGPLSYTATITPQPLVVPTSPACDAQPTVTINASVSDPADRVFLVRGVVLLDGSNLWPFYLNWVSSEPDGTKTFHGVLTLPPARTILITSATWGVALTDRRGQDIFVPGHQNLLPLALNFTTCSAEVMATPAPLQIIPSPTPTTAAAAPNNVIANTQAYPSPIYYGQTCPTLSSISFRAALNLPAGTTPDQVQALAHVGVTGPGGASAGNLLVPLMSNGSFDAASGGQIFLGSLSLSHSYNDSNNQFDPAALGGASGVLNWYVTVSQNNASGQSVELARSAPQTTNLAPCPTYAKPTSPPPAVCSLSNAACSLKGLKFDSTTCTCVP